MTYALEPLLKPIHPPHKFSRVRGAALAVLAGGLIGCRSPIVRLTDFAVQQGFEREIAPGNPFRHLVLRNHSPLSEAGLHVYIEGDGTPFVTPTRVASDPTPRQPLMLHLMALDSERAVYVGRPCYFGLQADPPCNPSDWAARRFSPEVLRSMATVIESEMLRSGAASVTLFGHSGGAALVILLTQKLSAVSGIVTVAGMLDSDAWTRLHGFTPLTGSLNPVEVKLEPTLASHTDHYAGADDMVVPPPLIRAAVQRIGGRLWEEPSFSHQCCWEKLWPSLLAERRRSDTAILPAARIETLRSYGPHPEASSISGFDPP